MNLFTTGALALTIGLGASGVARAAFPSCDPSVDNPRLEPLSNGTYPSDPAIPYTGSHHTKWAVDGLEIKPDFDDERRNSAAPRERPGHRPAPDLNSRFGRKVVRRSSSIMALPSRVGDPLPTL
jgi:hypothetical protein